MRTPCVCRERVLTRLRRRHALELWCHHVHYLRRRHVLDRVVGDVLGLHRWQVLKPGLNHLQYVRRWHTLELRRQHVHYLRRRHVLDRAV